MKVKMISLLLLMAASSFVLAACLNAPEISERALVQAVGIDLEGDMIKLTLQIFSPTTDGNANIGATAENARTIEVKGKTVSEAVQNTALIQGKQLFIGHCRVIVIGSELAKKGLEQPLSFFSSNCDSPQNVSLAIAERKASDVLKSKINQGILPADTLEKILENTDKNGMLQNVKLFEFLESLQNNNKSSVLPIIRVMTDNNDSTPKQSNDEENSVSEKIEEVSLIKISGMAIFVDAKMVGELNETQSRGLLWIKNKLKSTNIITSTDVYEVASLKIYKTKSKLIPIINEKDITFKLDISCEAVLGETMIKEGETAKIEDIETLQNVCSKIIVDECNQSFVKVTKDYKTDIFGFGLLIWKKDVNLWKSIKDDWEKNISNIKLDVSCKVIINKLELEFKQED